MTVAEMIEAIEYLLAAGDVIVEAMGATSSRYMQGRRQGLETALRLAKEVGQEA